MNSEKKKEETKRKEKKKKKGDSVGVAYLPFSLSLSQSLRVLSARSIH